MTSGMNRELLLVSDEYLQIMLECTIRSGKSVIKTREELLEQLKEYRNELLDIREQKTTSNE